MLDFSNHAWGFYIAAVVILSLIALLYLISSQSFFTQVKVKKSTSSQGTQPVPMDACWDDDLQEYDNPLPSWWVKLFYAMLIFAVGYLLLYPGLVSFGNQRTWSAAQQYQQEIQAADQQYGPLFARYQSLPIEQVAKDPQAHAMGQRLFATYCIQCHGSDARGAKGFPNLTDQDWLYGGTPDQILATIAHGRHGQMPPFGAALGEQQVKDVAQYVLQLANREHNPGRASRGQAIFTQSCAVCHGPDGKGNQSIGAPNLTDNIWLYGGSEATIIETITNGRNNVMPAWQDFLGDAKVHLLAAYVYSLSNP